MKQPGYKRIVLNSCCGVCIHSKKDNQSLICKKDIVGKTEYPNGYSVSVYEKTDWNYICDNYSTVHWNFVLSDAEKTFFPKKFKTQGE